MTLLGLLNNRYTIAKAFSKKFHDQSKIAVDDYEITEQIHNGVYNQHVKSNKEDIGKVPYIFATHESMLASFFENMPDIITSGRSAKDTTKANIVRALYSYLEDKLDLDEFLSTSAWWLFLIGFVSSHSEYKIEKDDDVPQLDSKGQPMTDDETGKEVGVSTYEYHDPIVIVDNPLKTYFSPESEFSIDAKKVPYYLTEKLVDTDEIKHIYNVGVEGDETLEVEGFDQKKDQDQSDLKRVKVMYYCGTLPSFIKDELKAYKEDEGAGENYSENGEAGEEKVEWEYGQEYKITFTKEKILHIEESEKRCKLAKLYGARSKFFGFGIGKSLKSFQDDMSIRRQQMVDYGNIFAYPWLAVNSETKVDQKALEDRKKRKPLIWSGDKGAPEYLVPPPMPQTIQQVDEASRSDAQFVSGTLDISKGAQQTNTVKTATGQQLFAQSQDKRLQKARKVIAKYYREVVIDLMKLCRDNWDDQEKEISYLNEDGEQQDAVITAKDLQGIDFDTDVDFNLDSISVNKDIISQRWIALLEQSKDLPFVNLPKVYAQTLRNSFNIPNPEGYIQEVPPEQPAPPSVAPVPPPAPSIPPDPQSPPMSQDMNPEPVMPQTMGAQMAPQPGAPY